MELKSLVESIKSNTPSNLANKGTLAFSEWKVTDLTLMMELLDVCEDTINRDSISQNGILKDFHLNLKKLEKYGFYYDEQTFFQGYKPATNKLAYILKIDAFSNSNAPFFLNYFDVVSLRFALNGTARYKIENNLDGYHLIFIDGKNCADLIMKYSVDDVKNLDSDRISAIKDIADVLVNGEEKKKDCFINEIIEYVQSLTPCSFDYFLKGVITLRARCQDSYSCYIKNFSTARHIQIMNKHVVDFSTRLSEIINSIQVKLVVIPTVCILVGSNLDYTGGGEAFLKNCVIIVSLFIFAAVMQVLMNNQFETLNMIHEQVSDYLNHFDNTKTPQIKDSIAKVGENEMDQRKRLVLLCIIMWIIPILHSSLVLYLASKKIWIGLCLSVLAIIVSIVLGCCYMRKYSK